MSEANETNQTNPENSKGVCEWEYDEGDCSWNTDCGGKWTFIDDGPEENHTKFCMYCGKPIKVI